MNGVQKVVGSNLTGPTIFKQQFPSKTSCSNRRDSLEKISCGDDKL